ncbi:MAG: SpoIIE family protein phosphatase [Cyanobium sp.]
MIAIRRFMRALSRQRGQLSIQQTYTTITLINGLVLIYLIKTAAEPLWGGNADDHATKGYLTFFLTVLLGILTVLSFRVIGSRVITPLSRLVSQAKRIENGETDAWLSARSTDEIGDLAHAFNLVLEKMRTAYGELDRSNAELLSANQQIADSIRYAGILQRSILPDHQLNETFGNRHFVLWEPKDIVGGDYYLFHSDGGRCLTGVADCAGHGVPGAMMTMMARVGVDRAIQEVGIHSPAAVLHTIDTSLREILSEDRATRTIATSMDMGLVMLDFTARKLRFAGARLSLYWSDGQELHSIAGDNRALCDRRRGSYHDHDIPLLSGFTYYLSTDGYLDQSGGDHGFAVGSERFCDWLIEHARKPLPDQQKAFSESLAQFRGHHPQRDDITILSFRFD